MNSSPGASSGIALLALMLPVMALLAGWGAFALWYQVPGGRALKAISVALWAVFSGTVLVASSLGRFVPAALAFGAAFGALLIWWRRRLPSNDRIWADDVSQMTKGVVQDSRVTLHNVRNFDWRTNSDYTQRWETRNYDLRILDAGGRVRGLVVRTGGRVGLWRAWAVPHFHRRRPGTRRPRRVCGF